MYVCKTGIYVLLWPNFSEKLPVWQNRVASKFFSDFPLLHDFMIEHGSNFQMQLLPLVKGHLKLLQENFEKYFTADWNATLDSNSWMLHPFTYDSVTTETEDLFDLQSDFGMKALIIKETPYTEFRVHLLHLPQYRSIAKKQFLFSFKCPQRIYAKVVFLVCVRSNLAKEVQSHTL